MNDSGLVFEGLARRDGAAFRFDWFGNVVTSTQHGAPQRSVRMSCSVLRPGLGWIKPAGEDDDQRGVPLAYLPGIRLGDVWQGGAHKHQSPLVRVAFPELSITDETAKVMPAGAPTSADEASAYVLPFTAFNAHRHHTGSWVTRVQVDTSTVLVVPSMELLRFYLGANGLLLERILSGANAEERLYSRFYLNPHTYTGKLTLGEGLGTAVAPTVARIAFEPRARMAFYSIVKTGQVALINEKEWHPRMGFPFTGTTNLTADGVWIEGDGVRTFVALKLVRCAYPYPFERLIFQTSDAAPLAPRARETSNKSKRSKKVEIANRPSDRRLAPVEIYADTDDTDPFPDLKGKQVMRQRFESNASAFGAAAAGAEGNFAIGPHRDGASRRAELLGAERAREDAPIEPALLAELRSSVVMAMPGFEIQSSAKGGAAHRIQLPAPRDNPLWEPKWVWLLICSGHSHSGDVMTLVLGQAEAPDGFRTVKSSRRSFGLPAI
jgi:hypothetical protein